LAPLQRIVIHVDFDYFFAQCEEIRHPEIKQRPVLVCVFSGRTGDSGVISTANYVARRHGVRSGMPIKIAKARLAEVDDALFLPLDATYYRQLSEKAMLIIKEYADAFEQTGIDECFIDVSRRANSFGDAEKLANKMKLHLTKSIHLSCSVGVAPNKILAKIASDYKKPGGLTLVRPEEVLRFISGLDVAGVPGIGPKTREKLAELGIRTAGDLASFDLFKLIEVLGNKTATRIHAAINGLDDDPVIESEGERKQIMHIVTLKKDAQKSFEMYADLEKICKYVYESALSKKVAFRSIGIILILDNLETITRSKVLKSHTLSFEPLSLTAKALLDDALKEKMTVRRLGVRLSDFQDNTGQGTLLDFMRQD
jgi:DNA polymerase IV (DinB-like DNA polymerase)